MKSSEYLRFCAEMLHMGLDMPPHLRVVVVGPHSPKWIDYLDPVAPSFDERMDDDGEMAPRVLQFCLAASIAEGVGD